MEKAETSWFLTIWLFLPRLAFFDKVWLFSQKMSGNPAVSTMLQDNVISAATAVFFTRSGVFLFYLGFWGFY